MTTSSPSHSTPELEARLRLVEKQLHQLIQTYSSLANPNNNNNHVGEPVSASRQSVMSGQSTGSLASLDGLQLDLTSLSLTNLRHRMRILRRWRNGSRLYSSRDLVELGQFVLEARLRTAALKLEQLRSELDDLDAVVAQTGADDVARTQRLQLEVQLNAVDDTMEQLLQGEEELEADQLQDREVSQLEDKLVNMATLLKALQDRLLAKERAQSHQPSGRAELSRGQSFERRRSKVRRKSFKRLRQIEEHPLVNRVLRNIGRIRRMLQAFKDGGHISAGDDGAVSLGDSVQECMANDVEVLERQLQRLERWQRLAEEFKAEDLDNLEHIVSAIEAHIKPDIDLDSPMRKPGSSKKGSLDVISDVTDGTSDTDSKPTMNGQGPAHSVSGSAHTTSSPAHSKEPGETGPQDGILNERLI